MKNLRKILSCLTSTCLALNPALAGAKTSNNFQQFDNNVTVSYGLTAIQNNATAGYIGLEANGLLTNQIWLNASAQSLISYNLNNNNRGLQNLNQNKSGSRFNLKAGYAFNWDKVNLIPYLSFDYNNLLIAYNYDSQEQFIFENPAYSPGLGLKSEFILIPASLKLGLDVNLMYSIHKSVMPNAINNLAHVNFDNYLISLSPEIQYNINSRLTLIGYYTLTSKFAGTATPPNVYYPKIDVNSSHVVSNDNLANSFGLKFGILF